MRTLTVPIALLLALAPLPAAAHSPLTSTDFHRDYAGVQEVDHARAHGLDSRTIALLRDPSVPSDVRAAMVNALGWSVDGQQNARAFASALAAAHGVAPGQLRAEHLSPEELLALGYMAALDDYFGLSPVGGATGLSTSRPIELLERAARAAPNDFPIAIVLALVRAQAHLDDPANGSCKAWSAVRGAFARFPQPSMRPDAVRRIAEYMDLYGGSCR